MEEKNMNFMVDVKNQTSITENLNNNHQNHLGRIFDAKKKVRKYCRLIKIRSFFTVGGQLRGGGLGVNENRNTGILNYIGSVLVD